MDLKRKYRPVLELAEREDVRVTSLRVEGGRLYLAGAAPSAAARGRILDAIKEVAPEAGDDIVAECTGPSLTDVQLDGTGSSDPEGASLTYLWAATGIVFDDATFLDKKYTVWGKVIEGMENVDKIKRGEPVQNPDKMISVKVAADA